VGVDFVVAGRPLVVPDGALRVIHAKVCCTIHLRGKALEAVQVIGCGGGQDRQQQAEASTAICCLVLLILFPAP
jgi:hypothetical protein